MGLDVDEEPLLHQRAGHGAVHLKQPGAQAAAPTSSASAGLIGALYDAGITMNDVDPDYVVMGETNTYNYENILKAVQLVQQAARSSSGTNPRPDRPVRGRHRPRLPRADLAHRDGHRPAAYFVGKPNPLMMRTRPAACWTSTPRIAAIIGDRMDTDIVAGIESGHGHGAGALRRDRPLRHQEVPLSSAPRPERRGRHPRRAGRRVKSWHRETPTICRWPGFQLVKKVFLTSWWTGEQAPPPLPPPPDFA